MGEKENHRQTAQGVKTAGAMELKNSRRSYGALKFRECWDIITGVTRQFQLGVTGEALRNPFPDQKRANLSRQAIKHIRSQIQFIIFMNIP